MDNIQELYSMIMGGDVSQFENDPEIRHISFYLCELLFKDYSDISKEAVSSMSCMNIHLQKEVHKEDQVARASLHRLVEDYTASALRNINDISKIADEDIIEQSSTILEELDRYDYMKSDNEFLHSVTSLCDDLLRTGDEKYSLIIAYEEMLEEVSKHKSSKIVNILKDKVKNVKFNVEQKLFLSFNNNKDDTLRIVSGIRALGLSSEEEIANEFIKNRSRYISECVDLIKAMSKESIHRCINEAALTLKTKIYAILLCYQHTFGNVDENVASLMRKAIFQFLYLISNAVAKGNADSLTPRHISEVKQELHEISQSFTEFGLSFEPLLEEIFDKLGDPTSQLS
ncbi:hypothetical protein BgAZ_101720 [Babesia gibsoni]|uniref:Uncharacterized protein n=1 Tax=Babesia gibsoni TaxID=33632 RepID=A0AAD8USQ3_BABGI|nr:hypothetical protein BgAZ_101720 [Babesia gibsoni]